MPTNRQSPVISPITFIRALIIISVLVLLATVGDRLAPRLPELEAWVEARGVWAPVFFIGFGLILSVCCLPLDLLSLAGGAVFGLKEGAVYVLAGLFAGQITVYGIGRFLLGQRILKMAESRPRLYRLREATRLSHPGLLILLRASPVPASPVAYLMGASRLPFSTFLIASLGMIPQALVMIFFGYATVHTSRLLHDPSHATILHNVILYATLLAAVIAVAWLAHKARKLIWP